MEVGLELPAKEQFITSLSSLERQAKNSATPEGSPANPHTFLNLLETIPGVRITTEDKQVIQNGEIVLTDQGAVMDLFADGAMHASASIVFGLKQKNLRELTSLRPPVSVVAFRKVVGEKAAEIRLRIDEGARFIGGSFLIGDRMPIDTGMQVEGSIDFNGLGELRHPAGNFQTHGIRKINVAKVITSLVNHEATPPKPHQILKAASS